MRRDTMAKTPIATAPRRAVPPKWRRVGNIVLVERASGVSFEAIITDITKMDDGMDLVEWRYQNSIQRGRALMDAAGRGTQVRLRPKLS